jgi:serine/threonine protein kinase
MAPEVAMGESYDKSADVFSFGMVVYELITRDKPPMRKLKDCYAFNGDDHAGAFLLSSSSSLLLFSSSSCSSVAVADLVFLPSPP